MRPEAKRAPSPPTSNSASRPRPPQSNHPPPAFQQRPFDNHHHHHQRSDEKLPLKKKARINTTAASTVTMSTTSTNNDDAADHSNDSSRKQQDFHDNDNNDYEQEEHAYSNGYNDDDDDDDGDILQERSLHEADSKEYKSQSYQQDVNNDKEQQQKQSSQEQTKPQAKLFGPVKHNNNKKVHHNSRRRGDQEKEQQQRPTTTKTTVGIVSASDRIILDVGGTEFVTALRTLTSNSSYFASVFSNTWLPPERPFLDQDPELFKVLLNFMRCGYLEEQALTKPLLLQAAYLGIDRLLQAVMVLAYRNSHADFVGSEEDAMRAFAQEYGDIVQATCQGHLPTLLFQTSPEPPKEYASLYFHKAKVPIPHMVAPQYRTGIRTSVLQTPECSTVTNNNNLMLEWSDAGGYFLPVFALNYLGKRGFTLADTDLQGFWDPRRLDDESEEIALGLDSPRQLGRLLGEVLFVRYQEQPLSASNSSSDYFDDSVTNVILSSRPKKQWTAQPKEYATVNYVKCVDGCVFIQAAGGVPRRVPRLAGEYLRDTGRLMCKSIALAMDWLQQHGFTHNEPQLEALLTRIGNEAKDDYYGPTMVFSRPLNETEPLLPCRLVNVDFSDETSHLRGHAARHG